MKESSGDGGQMDYAPGELVVVAGPTAVVVLPPFAATETLIEATWHVVRAASSLADTVRSLFVDPEGPALGAEKTFAVACKDDESVRLLFRGDLQIRVAGAGGVSRAVRSTSLTTWSEQELQDDDSIVSILAGDLATDRWLPLETAVVQASSIRWQVREPVGLVEPVDTSIHIEHAEAPAPAVRAPATAASVVPAPVVPARPAFAPEHSVSHRLLFGLPVTEPPAAERPAPEPPAALQGGPEETRLPLPDEEVAPMVASVSVDSSTDVRDPSGSSTQMLPEIPSDWIPARAPRQAAPKARRPPAAQPEKPGAASRPGPLKPARPAQPAAQPPTPVEPLRPVDAPTLAEPPTRYLQKATAGPAHNWDRGLTVMAPPELRRPVGPSDPLPLLAVRCPAGHLSQPELQACRVCGERVLDRDPISVRNPQLGRLCRQGAPDLPIQGAMVLGRKPEWTEPGRPPLLISVDDPERAVSRSHLAVTAKGWDVTVTDLGGENGTTVQTPDGLTHVLVPGLPMTIDPSTTITLADVVQFWFEVP